ncbi:hypothetical protein HBH61_044400 [Parastagonospora nodorum]|nr:hypothetical protein HBH61_044400 [Parastagonospora nodorum]KAH5641628.1 hypothetical protein HBI51_135430 [Parastagonospora nodorum]
MDTPTLDFLINNPPTPTSPTSSNPSSLSTILQNWPSTPSLLPPHIPHDLTPALLSALATLSEYTQGQPERAWSLVNTYYVCRIREARGRKGKGVEVEVRDVEKAVESARRMSVGKGIETAGRKYSIRDEGVQGEGNGKRKWSVRHDVDEKKRQRCEEVGGDVAILPPLSARFDDEPRFGRRQALPRKKSSPLLIEIPRVDVGAAQAATHEANLARMELEAAEEGLNAARARYADAQRSYGEAKRMAKRARLGI